MCEMPVPWLNEMIIAGQYREYARSLELEFPQTSKVLRLIADEYAIEAKQDRLEAELFPQ